MIATGSSVNINEIRSQASQLQAAGKTFDQLFTDSTQATNISESVNSKQTEPGADTYEHLIFDVSDPRTVLAVKSNAKKATHITQFLSERTKKKQQSRRREFELAQPGSEDNFVLKQQEHPYSGISMDEWSAANCRLMSHLIHSGELSTEDIDYYLAYSTTGAPKLINSDLFLEKRATVPIKTQGVKRSSSGKMSTF